MTPHRRSLLLLVSMLLVCVGVFLYAPYASAANCSLDADLCDQGEAFSECTSALERTVSHAVANGYPGDIAYNCTMTSTGTGKGFFLCSVKYGSVWKCNSPTNTMQNEFRYVSLCTGRPNQTNWKHDPAKPMVCYGGCAYESTLELDICEGCTAPGQRYYKPTGQLCKLGTETPPPEDCPPEGCPPPDDDDSCPEGQSDPDGDGVCTPNDDDGDGDDDGEGGECEGNKVDPDGDGTCSCPVGQTDPDGDNVCTGTDDGDGDGDDDGDGDGTEGCKPGNDCTGAGGTGSNINGDLYKRDAITFDTEIKRLLDGLKDSRITSFGRSFFGGCSGGGSCPNENWTAGLWGFSFDLSIFCGGVLASLIAFAGWVSFAGMALFAFRIALL